VTVALPRLLYKLGVEVKEETVAVNEER